MYLGTQLSCEFENDGGDTSVTSMSRRRKTVFLHELVVNHGLQITAIRTRCKRLKAFAGCDDGVALLRKCVQQVNSQTLTSRFKKRVSGFHRLCRSSFHSATLFCFMAGTVVTRIDDALLSGVTGTAFLRARPIGVTRAAPLIERDSEPPGCDEDNRLVSWRCQKRELVVCGTSRK